MKACPVYLTVDFECFQPNQWQSVGMILYDSSSGTIVHQLHAACARGLPTQDTLEFWRRHPAAFLFNQQAGRDTCLVTEEQRICDFVRMVKTDYPNFYLVTDNPEYDVGLLNSLLIRHDQSVMSRRGPTTYFQSICTWSSKKTLAMLGVPIVKRTVPGLSGPGVAHTPLYDCTQVLQSYLCTLQTITQLRRGLQKS
jgi:hypothetical protein